MPTPRLTIQLSNGHRHIGGIANRFSAGQKSSTGQGITDGTSNTIMFSELKPQTLQSGFGLLLPASARPDFTVGALLPALSLLPYIEQDNVYRTSTPKSNGLKVPSAKVTNVEAAPGGNGDILVWIQPQGIIAILIGL